MAKREYVVAEEAGAVAEPEAEPEAEPQPAPPGWGELILRSVYDNEGNLLGKDENGDILFSYRARDTGEVLWVGTFRDALAWSRSRTGIEPIDRHAAYWERRYAARRFARRCGALPIYADCFAEARAARALLRAVLTTPGAVALLPEPLRRRITAAVGTPSVYERERV